MELSVILGTQSFHTMFTSFLESLHTWSHSIPESLHTLRHFIPWVTSYPKSLHTWLHFIPRTISYHGPLHTIDHLIPWITSYHGLLHTFYTGNVDHFIPYRYCSSHTDHMFKPKGEFWIGPYIGNPKNTILAGRLQKFWTKRFSKLWFHQSHNSNKVWVFLFSELKIYGLFAQNKRF